MVTHYSGRGELLCCKKILFHMHINFNNMALPKFWHYRWECLTGTWLIKALVTCLYQDGEAWWMKTNSQLIMYFNWREILSPTEYSMFLKLQQDYVFTTEEVWQNVFSLSATRYWDGWNTFSITNHLFTLPIIPLTRTLSNSGFLGNVKLSRWVKSWINHQS